ncbi:MAG: DJ-1/PfpI family protein, partial [Pseudomonadota bacterium]
MHDFTVIALEGAYGTSVAATLDLLGAAGEIAPRNRAPAPRWRLCSMKGGSVRLQSGMQVDTSRLVPKPRADTSTWVIPGLALNTESAVMEGLEREDCRQLACAIAAHIEGGGRVAACCSAVFLLHLAGVLEGRQATTSWWLAPLLQRLAPGAKVNAKRMVCVDGPVVTGGAAFAQVHLPERQHLARR